MGVSGEKTATNLGQMMTKNTAETAMILRVSCKPEAFRALTMVLSRMLDLQRRITRSRWCAIKKKLKMRIPLPNKEEPKSETSSKGIGAEVIAFMPWSLSKAVDIFNA